jgi:hypothetical protein
MNTTDTTASPDLNQSAGGQRQWDRIRKRPEYCAGANLPDYEKGVLTFS